MSIFGPIFGGIGTDVSASGTLFNDFLLKGDGSNALGAVSPDGVSGFFVDTDNDILHARPVASGVVGFTLQNASGADRASYRFLTTVGEPEFLLFNDSTLIFTKDLATDDKAFLNWVQTNGDNVNIKIRMGTIDPISNIEGLPGDIYYRQNGIDSTMSINIGSALNDTDWCVTNATEHFVFNLIGALPLSLTTRYLKLGNNETATSKEDAATVRINRSGTLRDLHVQQVNTSAVTGTDITYKVRVNKTDTLLKITVDSADGTLKTNEGVQINVSPGNIISLEVTKSQALGESDVITDIKISLGLQ